MDFRTALNNVIADLTPQPWEHTDEAGVTLTVIPAGLREDPGHAEVYVQITASKTQAVQAAIQTRHMTRMITSLTGNRMWLNETLDDVYCGLTPMREGGMLLTLSGDVPAVVQVQVPEEQRLPLASALHRALDVARSWES